MRCPKCGYISFDQIDKCLRCGKNIETTAAEVNGSAYNVPAPDYLVFDVHEKREQNDAETSEEIVEDALEAGEVVDFDFASESSDAPVEVDLDSVEEVEVEVAAEDEGEHEIEMDMNFFEEESAVAESSSPAVKSDVEEEGIAFDFDTPPAGPVSPVAFDEDITEKVEEVFEKAEEIELDDSGLDHLFDTEEPAPAPVHDSSKLSMDDFDMDLDLGDLDLGLDDEKK